MNLFMASCTDLHGGARILLFTFAVLARREVMQGQAIASAIAKLASHRLGVLSCEIVFRLILTQIEISPGVVAIAITTRLKQQYPSKIE